jgi:hypothetical protein
MLTRSRLLAAAAVYFRLGRYTIGQALLEAAWKVNV